MSRARLRPSRSRRAASTWPASGSARARSTAAVDAPVSSAAAPRRPPTPPSLPGRPRPVAPPERRTARPGAAGSAIAASSASQPAARASSDRRPQLGRQRVARRHQGVDRGPGVLVQPTDRRGEPLDQALGGGPHDDRGASGRADSSPNSRGPKPSSTSRSTWSPGPRPRPRRRARSSAVVPVGVGVRLRAAPARRDREVDGGEDRSGRAARAPVDQGDPAGDDRRPRRAGDG